VQQMVVQLLQPALEDGEGGAGGCIDTAIARGSCQQCGAAILLETLANLRPVEIVKIALATAASRMNRRYLLQRLLDKFLSQQFAEYIEDDAIADTQEEVQRSGHDAFGIDLQQCWLSRMKRVTISFSAVTR